MLGALAETCERPVGKDVADEGVAHGQTPADFLRRAHQEVEREWGAGREADLDGLLDRVALVRENDQEIDIGVRTGPPFGVGPEEDDPPRAELAGNAA